MRFRTVILSKTLIAFLSETSCMMLMHFFMLLANLSICLQQEIAFVDQDDLRLTWSNKHVWWNNLFFNEVVLPEKREGELMISLNYCFMPHFDHFNVFKCFSVYVELDK